LAEPSTQTRRPGDWFLAACLRRTQTNQRIEDALHSVYRLRLSLALSVFNMGHVRH